jgi:M6 family metalloprotease-like protein
MGMSEAFASVDAERPSRFASLRDSAGGTIRRLMATAGVIVASAALAPVALADYEPSGGYVGATGEHNMAVVLVNFDGSSPPLDPAQINETMFTAPDSVSNYYSAASLGKLQLHGEVVGSVELPDILAPSCDSGDFLKIGAAANAAIKKASGIDLNGYDNYVYVLSQQADCLNKGGLVLDGQTMGNASFINRVPGTQSEGVDVHEIGHQFGLSHANTVHCYGPNGNLLLPPLGFNVNCMPVIYQDPFDPMGTARFSTTAPIDFDGLNKARLGWLGPQNIITVTHSETITIAPDEVPSSQPQLVRIPYSRIDGVERYLYADYRQPTGEDAKVAPTDPLATMFHGVTLREAGPNDRGKPITLTDYSNLIDTNPKTKTALDAPLGVGRTYRDSKTGIAIRTLDLSPSGAEVRITVPRH